MNIYVGNLSNRVTEEKLRALFEQFGQVTSVKVIKDKFTGTSKGFGFVEMSNPSETQATIAGLNQQEFEGQRLRVNEARPREAGAAGSAPRFNRGPRPNRF